MDDKLKAMAERYEEYRKEIGITKDGEIVGLGRKLTPEELKTEWEKFIWDRNRGRCSNCGSEDRLRVKMVVPIEAGGKLVESNGVLLCRTCEMAAEAANAAGGAGSVRRPVNFWVSRSLYDRIQEGIKTRNGFSSMGSLIRYLMTKYVLDEHRFDDLESYQDSGADVKINVWVPMDGYSTFKQLIDKRGMTVTDGIKALVRMYESEAEPLVSRRSEDVG